jgi:flagellar hook-associated protein 3 FlgL
MTMRVATFAMSDRMLTASLRTQGKMAEMQLQQASGQVSGDYGGLGASSNTLISLEVSLARSQSYVAAATEAGARVQVMYDALSSMTDLLSSFRSELAATQSTDSNAVSGEALIATAQSKLEEFASLLNTQYEGRYLFAGGVTTAKPVDIEGYAATDATTVSTSYYLGDSTIPSVQISVEQTVAYGVTADNPAFEQAFRALSLIANSSGTPDGATLDAVSDLIVSALDQTTVVQSKLSINAATFERAIESQQDYQDFIAASVSNIKDVDVTAIAVRLTLYETQLQASYSALARIQSLNLVDYLR